MLALNVNRLNASGIECGPRASGYAWRNHAWSIVVNDQVALWTDQVALPSDLIKQFM